MAAPWTYAGDVARFGSGHGTVTLVEGTSFCLSADNGDVLPDSAEGLYFLDTRFLSQLELRIDGRHLEPLGAALGEPFSATFLGRSHPLPERADSGLVVFRRRHVGRGMREELEVRNYASERCDVAVELAVAVDFADLFAVKEGRVEHRGRFSHEMLSSAMRFGHQLDGRLREVEVAFSEPAQVASGRATWHLHLPPGGSWTTCVGVVAAVDRVEIEPRYRCGEPVARSKPEVRLAAWRRAMPELHTDHAALAEAVRQAAEDLGALRIFDPEHPDRVVVAAGAPWFMTVFGRDSLLAGWMALLVDPDLARGALETLARFQGTRVDPETEEEPGRILHEMRFGGAPSLSLGGGTVYYGSADATPLFVMLLGELRRWGLDDAAVKHLLPHADRALRWIDDYGDADGDGYVEYERKTPRGLANQGWKDSWDAIRYADGRVAAAPLALCEVQGYVYAAYIARAQLADESGDVATYERYRRKAAELKAAFNRDFWLPDRGWFAVALDADKRPVDSLASNMGHCLWTGIVDADKAASVAQHLLSPAMFSGWGVRTLAASTPGYNPVSYHCGSVWPHDNALIASGLMRYGFVDHAHRVIEAMLDVAASNGGRLPELFSGLGRDEVGVPAAYPTSCVPQAWAAASPLLFLRTLLRIDPWVPRRRLWVAPALPPSINRLRLDRVPVGTDRIDLEVDYGSLRVRGLSPDVELVRAPRGSLSAAPSSSAAAPRRRGAGS